MKVTFAHVLLWLPAILSGTSALAADAPPPAPPLVFAFELRATVGDPVVIGQVPHGLRRIVAITGGTVRGPALSGVVVPNSGADWQMIQPDGFSELDTRYTRCDETPERRGSRRPEAGLLPHGAEVRDHFT